LKDYYQILGIGREASKEEIKKAFKLHASKFHPDKHGGDKFFEEKFKEIKEAYDVLSDINKRARYYKAGLNYGNTKIYPELIKKQKELKVIQVKLHEISAKLKEKEKAIKEREAELEKIARELQQSKPKNSNNLSVKKLSVQTLFSFFSAFFKKAH
jgi:DnaJ-class molecular chaperone